MLYTIAAQQQSEGSSLGSLLFVLILSVLMIAALWKMFTKAGQPGWASLVPIYNLVVLLKISGRPWWWLLLMFVPFVNIVISIILYMTWRKCLAKAWALPWDCSSSARSSSLFWPSVMRAMLDPPVSRGWLVPRRRNPFRLFTRNDHCTPAVVVSFPRSA